MVCTMYHTQLVDCSYLNPHEVKIRGSQPHTHFILVQSFLIPLNQVYLYSNRNTTLHQKQNIFLQRNITTSNKCKNDIIKQRVYAAKDTYVFFWDFILTVQCDAMYNGTHCFKIVERGDPSWNLVIWDWNGHATQSAAQGGRIAELITEEMGEAVKPIAIQSNIFYIGLFAFFAY